MSIFQFYPKVAYKVDNIDYIKAIDITTSIKIKDFFKTYRGISFNPYVVKDGERPDYVSYKFYQTPMYDWVILLSNNIYNIYDDWPKSTKTLNSYVEEKYGTMASALGTVKYYYNLNNDIIDETTWNNLPANQRKLESQYEYEVRRNINKSKIKLVKRNLISAVDLGLKSIKSKPVL
jgi:asparagine N-glycosylation enzyme membrane subunit Stt3